MACRLTCRLLLLCCLAVSALAAADWSQVKTGLTPEKTEKLLGKPLIRTNGRGFEVWIYDSRGEVLFEGGPATAWSLPVPNPESASRPVERDVLMKPLLRLPPLRKPELPTQPGRAVPAEISLRYLHPI